jgi:hypothetical protein
MAEWRQIKDTQSVLSVIRGGGEEGGARKIEKHG